MESRKVKPFATNHTIGEGYDALEDADGLVALMPNVGAPVMRRLFALQTPEQIKILDEVFKRVYDEGVVPLPPEEPSDSD